MAQSINYFVNGHTAAGYVNYLADNLQNIEDVIVLKYDDDRELTEFFKAVVKRYEKEGSLPEIISGLSSRTTVAGVIIRESQTAILAQSIVQDPISGAKLLDLNKFTDKDRPTMFDREREGQLFEAAYAYFRRGLDIHDDLEAIYIKEMDFNKADQVAADFIGKLLQDAEQKEREPVVFERLFITNTPDGKVNHAKELIAPLQNIYYVKGRAGTGKSVFMKKVLHACKEYGFDVEVYHCSFDPESVDMIIVRDLDFCIFDSTPPHELSPENGKGEIIDLYALTVASGTDERNAEEIKRLTSDYQAAMKKGIQELQQLNNVYGEPGMNLQVEPALQAVYNVMK